MIKLDDNLLQELGLGNLPPEEKKKMLAHIYETLEMRVGMELAKQMSDAQLSEFEEFINRNDEAGALRWLETNFPNYKEVVAAEFEKLKLEVKQAAPQIAAASQQQPVMQPSAQSDPYAGQQQQMQQPYAQPMPPGPAPMPQTPPAPFPPIQGEQQQSFQQPPLPPIQDGGQPRKDKDDYGLAA